VERVFSSLGRTRAAQAFCPRCPDTRREVSTLYKVRGDESFLDLTLADIGVPPFDILTARYQNRAVGLELTADAAEILGPLAASAEGLQWN
jgi:hypothetical protein